QEPAAKIPYCRRNDAARLNDPPHFAHGLYSIRDEIQRKLRERRRKTAIRVGQAASIADRKTDAGGTRARPRKYDIGSGDIDASDLIRRSAFGQGESEAPGAAPDVEHLATILWSRKFRKRTGEQPRPPPEKPLVGAPVAGAVYR